MTNTPLSAEEEGVLFVQTEVCRLDLSFASLEVFYIFLDPTSRVIYPPNGMLEKARH